MLGRDGKTSQLGIVEFLVHYVAKRNTVKKCIVSIKDCITSSLSMYKRNIWCWIYECDFGYSAG